MRKRRNFDRNRFGLTLAFIGLAGWILPSDFALSRPAPSSAALRESSSTRPAYSGSSFDSIRTTPDSPRPVNIWTSNGPEGEDWLGGSVSAFIVSLAIDPSDPNTIYAGAATGDPDGNLKSMFKSTNGGASWSTSDSGLGFISVGVLAVDPSNANTIYAGTSGQTQGVSKSTDGGASWSLSKHGLPDGYGVIALAINPSNTNIIYAGTYGRGEQGVFKSTDGGENWSPSMSGLPDPSVHVLAIDPSNTNTIYLGTFYEGVFKSTSGGASWTERANGLPKASVQTLAIDPSNTNTIYAGTFHKGVFKSTDGGASWRESNTGLPDPSVDALAIDPSNTNTIYAGTYGGVFKSADGGESWSPFNDGLTDLNVHSLVIDSSGNHLHAGTSVGVFDYQDASPRIISAAVAGKKLFILGENFDDGAVILLNGEEQKTRNDEENPKTTLIGKRAGKKIKPGDKLQVRNPNGTLSQEFTFTGE